MCCKRPRKNRWIVVFITWLIHVKYWIMLQPLLGGLGQAWNNHYRACNIFNFAVLGFLKGLCLSLFYHWLFVCFTSHRHRIGHISTFQLYWWKKTSGPFQCIISVTNGE
jgi:hypothetical protein